MNPIATCPHREYHVMMRAGDTCLCGLTIPLREWCPACERELTEDHTPRSPPYPEAAKEERGG